MKKSLFSCNGADLDERILKQQQEEEERKRLRRERKKEKKVNGLMFYFLLIFLFWGFVCVKLDCHFPRC